MNDEMTDDEFLIVWAASSMSDPLEIVNGLVPIKADVAQAILQRADCIAYGIDMPVGMCDGGLIDHGASRPEPTP